jgi:hypothetical protein
LSCPFYSVFNTDNAQLNYASCDFYACPGTYIIIDGGCSCNGDQYFRLYNFSNIEIASNDDYCHTCSRISIKLIDECQTYSIREGCFGSYSCSGIVKVIGAINLVTGNKFN